MITNRNAQAALLVTFTAVAALVVLMLWVIRDTTTNLASEIAKSGGAQHAVVVEPGTTFLLIPDVSLTIGGPFWSESIVLTRENWRGSQQVSVTPTNPEFRFLVVSYQIENDSDRFLTRKGLADLIRVVAEDGSLFEGKDVDTITSPDRNETPKSVINRLLEIPSSEIHVGRWIFEVDSRLPNLTLVSELLGFDLPLRVDSRR